MAGSLNSSLPLSATRGAISNSAQRLPSSLSTTPKENSQYVSSTQRKSDSERGLPSRSSSTRHSSKRSRHRSPTYSRRSYSRSRSRSRSRSPSPRGGGSKRSTKVVQKVINVWVATSYQNLGEGFIVGLGIQFDDSIGQYLHTAFIYKKSPLNYSEFMATLLILAVLKWKNMDHMHVRIHTNTPFLSKIMMGNVEGTQALTGRENALYKFILQVIKERPGEVMMKPSFIKSSDKPTSKDYMQLAKTAAVNIRRQTGPDYTKLSTVPSCLWTSPYGQQFADYFGLPMKDIHQSFDDALHGTYAPRPSTPARTSTPLSAQISTKPSYPPNWPSELPFPVPFEMASKLIADLMAITAPPTPDEMTRLSNDQHLLSKFDPLQPQQPLYNHNQYSTVSPQYHRSPALQASLTHKSQLPQVTYQLPPPPPVYQSMPPPYFQPPPQMPHQGPPSVYPPPAQPSAPTDPRLRQPASLVNSQHQNSGSSLNYQSQSPSGQVPNMVHPSRLGQVDTARHNIQQHQPQRSSSQSASSSSLPNTGLHQPQQQDQQSPETK